MGTPIVVDCEAPFGVGAPSVGDMTEFGAVDVNALQDGRVETFHGVDCSEDTFRQFREWLTPRMPVVFVSDNPAYDFQWINFYFWRYFGANPFGHSGRRIADSTLGWSVISAALRSGSVFAERSTIIIPSMTRSGTPKRSFVCSMGSADRRPARDSYRSGCGSMFQETSHSGSAPGSPHTRRPCSRASAMLDFRSTVASS